MLVEIFLAFEEAFGNVVAKLQLRWVGAENKRSSKIGLPLLEDRAQIQKKNVIHAHGQVGRVLFIRRKRIAPGANDALVPVSGNSKHLLGEIVDVLVQLAFQDVGANETASFHRMEEVVRFGLSLQQGRRAVRYRFVHAAQNSTERRGH